MAKRAINHKKEFKRNGIIIGRPRKGCCSVSKTLFRKFEEKWEDRRK